MGLTRKFLKGMGISDEQIDAIIDAHTETVDALKAQRDELKADAEEYAETKKKLEAAEKTIAEAGKDSYKVKYEALKEDFDKYKHEQTQKETHGAKLAAYREMLKACGISEKRIESVLKVSDVDSVELDENGAIKDADKKSESIKAEWADFIPTEPTKGANTATPPTGGSGSADPSKMTFAEYKEWRKKNT